jgi:hypothetical protein
MDSFLPSVLPSFLWTSPVHPPSQAFDSVLGIEVIPEMHQHALDIKVTFPSSHLTPLPFVSTIPLLFTCILFCYNLLSPFLLPPPSRPFVCSSVRLFSIWSYVSLSLPPPLRNSGMQLSHTDKRRGLLPPPSCF